MTSEDLLMFLSVATSGNFSRAAIEVGLSQSALSRKISTLEAELNIRLFYRSGRGVVLTEPGHRLVKYATEVKELLEHATADLSSPEHQGPSSIVLAAQPTIAKILFGSIGKALKQEYPGIKMRFKEGLGGYIREWIANGEIDAAIVYLPENHASLGADVILREQLYFVAPPEFGPIGKGFPVERLAKRAVGSARASPWTQGSRGIADGPLFQVHQSQHGVRRFRLYHQATGGGKLRLHDPATRSGARGNAQRHLASRAADQSRDHPGRRHHFRTQQTAHP